ncbi:MAG: RHS repeat domain-containing protein [Pirellula sp.]
MAERYAYSAYGEPTILNASGSVLAISAINNRYSYTGREWDATVGLHHFRARWMSPKTGRFLGRDPIGFEGGSYSIVEYCHSKPHIYMDPFGKQIMPLPAIPGQNPPPSSGNPYEATNLTPAQQSACMTKAIKDKESCDDRALNICAIVCGTWIVGWPTIDTIKVIEATNSIPKPTRGCLGRSWVKHYRTAAACFACSYWPRACDNDYNCNVKYCTTGKTTIGCGWFITPSF